VLQIGAADDILRAYTIREFLKQEPGLAEIDGEAAKDAAAASAKDV
jgi:hypothetical protein